jgi:predicted protein tyrosine phosphatase
MTAILPNLWFGSIGCTYDREFLRSNNITHIISVVNEDSKSPLMTELGIQTLCIQLNDREDESIYDYFAETTAFITNVLENNSAVLVHCLAGVSRSPTILAAYLIRVHNMSVQDSLDYIFEKVKTQGYIIHPTDGFLTALDKWANPNEGFLTSLYRWLVL